VIAKDTSEENVSARRGKKVERSGTSQDVKHSDKRNSNDKPRLSDKLATNDLQKITTQDTLDFDDL